MKGKWCSECDVSGAGHVIMNRLLMKLLAGGKRLPGGREHIRMKRWIGSIVLASLGTLALAQAPFTVVRPADGAKEFAKRFTF